MSLCYFDRERVALVRLSEAIKSRAGAEAELAAAFQLASEKAERDLNRARKTNAANRETDLSAIDRDHGTVVRQIAAWHDAEILSINRAREEKRAAVVQKYKIAEEKGKAEYNDRLWSLASILEGGEKKAKDQMELLQRKAAAGKDQIEQLWQQAKAPLARCKVTIDLDGEAVPPQDDDPISGMQKAIADGEETLDQLKNLFWPKLANLGGLLLCIALMAAVGASTFAFLDLITAATISAAVGIVFGLILWLLIKSLAWKRTIHTGTLLRERLAVADAACHRLHLFAKREYDEESERITEKHDRKRKETELYYLPLFALQNKQYEEGLGRIVDEH
jgi:DNA segregation ATPase FtsK/SpoIIIE, S-DNA-T family